jgi:ABC-type lipoprotein export system ATPase subunit/ABC-type antimicrobial peptide transport system permease subunit
MIKLKNLHKYYNKNKQNEIHVLNDINLELPNHGLVVLLGPSGSGKTTLLNVIGGLDKVNNGTISYGDIEIKHYNSKVWDKIRNHEVGYIFQNYNLLTHLTVYENISLTLHMIGVYDKTEIDKRIDYILNRIGMINFRKRRASQLSGGQQQRVAIARALAKNPKVIIADEPTGNLDSKNTQEIMNIIKAISRNKLVVLVTHEESLANYYADRIIRLQDGCIVSDDINISNSEIDFQHDTDIYLGDMSQVLKENHLEIFSDEKTQPDFKVRLIVKNRTLYVDINNNEYTNVQLLENDSEIRIKEGSYKKIKREEFVVEDFNLEEVISDTASVEIKHSVISLKENFQIAWKRMKNTNIMGKVIYIAFGLIAGLVALSVGMGNQFITIDPKEYLDDSEKLVLVDKGLNDYEQLKQLEDDSNINSMRLYDRTTVTISLPKVFQSYSNQTSMNGVGEDITLLSTDDYVAGEAAVKETDFVISERVADQLINQYDTKSLGITTYNDLLELNYYITIPGDNNYLTLDLHLSGIVSSDSPLIYMNEDILLMITYQVGILEFFQDDISISKGVLPTNEKEIIVYDNGNLPDQLDTISQQLFDENVIVSGAYIMSDASEGPQVLVPRDVAKELYFNSTYKTANAKVPFLSDDPEKAVSELTAKDFIASDYITDARTEFHDQRVKEGIGTISFIVVVLAISAISYFFVIRSSLLSRIYEVSVYRALGVSRSDIHKMFILETVLVTTLTSIIGYSLMSFLLYRLQTLIEDFTVVARITPLSILVGLLLIYIVNILSGLIPVANLLRKTPAEILSDYDF